MRRYMYQRADASHIEAGLMTVLFDPAERSRVLDASKRVLSRYSWTICARQVLDTLVESAAG